MRDIRGELQERASLFEEQINAHEAEFEKHIEQLKRERDSRLENLNAELEAVTRLMEIEVRRLSSAPPSPTVQTREPLHPAVHQPAQQSAHQPPQHSPPPQHSARQPVQHSSHRPQPQPKKQAEQPLADFLVDKLNEVGAMSLDALRRVALQEGYFADAGLDVHNALFKVVKAGIIQQLPGGDFAPTTIRLRRAV